MILIDTVKIIVNIVGGLAMMIFALSSLIKRKRNVLATQSVAHTLLIVSEALNKTYSSIVQEVISIIRNIAVILKKDPKWFMILLVILGTGCGIAANIVLDNNAWIGYLPIAANLEFSICVISTHVSERNLKLSLFASNALWAVFFIFTGNYFSGGFNCLTAALSLVSFFTYEKNKESFSSEENKAIETENI